MRGRKRVPNVLRLIAGNPSKRPLNRSEPNPVGDLLASPAGLTDEELEIWNYAIEHAPKGLLRLLDLKLFLGWVLAAAEVDLAERMLREHGREVKKGGDQRITINPDGSQVKTVRSVTMVLSNWVKIRREAFQRMMKATSELGFSPTSRSRITLAGGGKKEANRFSNNAASKRA